MHVASGVQEYIRRESAAVEDSRGKRKDPISIDASERRLKEWENYQRSHKNVEDQQSCMAFLDLAVDNALTGRMLVELYAKQVPNTVKRFCSLVSGSAGKDARTGQALDYCGLPVSRINRSEGTVLLGDFETYGIAADTVAEEAFVFRHKERGLLSSAAEGPHALSHACCITLGPAPLLDFKQVVFGKVVDGLNVLDKLEELPVNKVGIPLSSVTIVLCGMLTGERPADST